MTSKVKFTFRTSYNHFQTTYLGVNGGAFWSLRINHNFKRLEIKRSNADILTAITVSIEISSKFGARKVSGVSTVLDVDQKTAYFTFPDRSIPLGSDILEGSIEVDVQNQFSSDRRGWDIRVQDSTDSTQLSRDFLHMLNLKDFADATLKCGDAEFPVHRCMLSVRSPVFASMFKNQMKKTHTRTVEITNMTPEVLQATLIYMYSNSTDHITKDLAEELLFTAEKYLLDDLKLVCIEMLKKHATVSNVSHLLALGDWLDDSLKEFAMEYIRKFNILPKVQKTDSWKSLKACRPDLVEEMLAAY